MQPNLDFDDEIDQFTSKHPLLFGIKLFFQDIVSYQRFSNLEKKITQLEQKMNIKDHKLMDQLDSLRLNYLAFTPSSSSDTFYFFPKYAYYELKTSLDLGEKLFDYFSKENKMLKNLLIAEMREDLYKPLTFAYKNLLYRSTPISNSNSDEIKLTKQVKKAMILGKDNGAFSEYWRMLKSVFFSFEEFYKSLKQYGISFDVLKKYIMDSF